MRVEFVRHEPPEIPTGFWRGVGPNNNVFAIESFIDELARKAGKDPIDFRLPMLARKTPRLKAALDLAAQKAGWGKPLPPRTGRGVAVQVSFASFIATISEVEVDPDGEVFVHRITSAVDTGIAVNPDTIVAQLQGGLIFGLTAALYGEITIANGRVQQSNFNDYRMLRIDQTPSIDVHLIRSGEPPGGIGETGATAAPPALRNAIYAATGIPLRRLPFDRDVLAGRKAS
jgi:isoquinoline 1-oxidoreductase beta subunit